MRALIVCITLLFAFLTCTMAQIPSVKVENAKGAQVNTSSLVNHKTPMIISFWATTCKPCIRELDAINEQLPDWLEEAKFRVVAVSTDDSRSTAKARALAEGHGWDDFIMLYDKKSGIHASYECEPDSTGICSGCRWEDCLFTHRVRAGK